jgi:hypothetical protein
MIKENDKLRCIKEVAPFKVGDIVTVTSVSQDGFVLNEYFAFFYEDGNLSEYFENLEK